MIAFPTKKSRIVRAALLGVAGMILASGCVFEPRVPLDPSGEEVDWIRPTAPENVLFNMKAALESRTSTNYGNSLSDDFRFVPSSVVGNDYPGYFENFGKDRELEAVNKLYQRVDSLRVEWNYDVNNDLVVEGDRATIFLESYQLYVSYVGSPQVVYEGYAELILEYKSSNWILVDWDESPALSPNSWGLLRAELDVPPPPGP
jgi:hypothetical protein